MTAPTVVTAGAATVPVDVPELWSEVFGAAGESWSWWREVTFHGDANWNVPGEVTLGIEDPDDHTLTRTKRCTVQDLLDAVGQATTAYVDACTGDPIHPTGEWDACTADVVMQVMVLGTAVYG